MFNGRPNHLILPNVFRPHNYVAFAKIGLKVKDPLTNARRYLFGGGSYPAKVAVRTPLGAAELTLYGGHDAVTVTEVFCGDIYRTKTPPRVVVDMGSNIGVSAMYFLTRSPECFCYLYEPDPRNVVKIRDNLRGFEGRFDLTEAAVGPRDEISTFFCEMTGRQGTLDPTVWFVAYGNADHTDEISRARHVEEIKVRVESADSILGRVLERHGSVDVLKVDTEGTEHEILDAIAPEHLRGVRWIVAEWYEGRHRHHCEPPALPGFRSKAVRDMVYYSNVGVPAGS